MRRGSCHDPNSLYDSADRIRANRSPGAASQSAVSVSTVYDGPDRSISKRLISNAGLPSTAASTIATRSPTGEMSRPGLCGGCAAGMNKTRRSPNASRAASATARWARWIGSNVPPKTPVAPVSRSSVTRRPTGSVPTRARTRRSAPGRRR